MKKLKALWLGLLTLSIITTALFIQKRAVNETETQKLDNENTVPAEASVNSNSNAIDLPSDLSKEPNLKRPLVKKEQAKPVVDAQQKVSHLVKEYDPYNPDSEEKAIQREEIKTAINDYNEAVLPELLEKLKQNKQTERANET